MFPLWVEQMMWWEGVKMVYHWTLGKKEKWWPKKGRYFPRENAWK